MRNLKKFLALVLAMMMALSLMVTANAMNPNYDYPDVEEATFDEAIDVLTGMGVFRGDNGNFYPTRPIMRSEAVAILYRLVTGDVSDSQAQLYAPAAAQFNDVLPNAWYAGYVGFAVDAGFVKGYNGDFMPNQNVTGYEMLAMLLRAVGYGKNGEFTGSQWMVNVGSTAQSLGILDNIQSTHYANTLSRASTREVVAELTFQTAATVPTVRYEYGYYNQYTGVVISGVTRELNPTLGEKVFNLSGATGIVVGNQETGEDATLMCFGYRENSDGDKIYDIFNQYSHDDVAYTGDPDPANIVYGSTVYEFDAETGLNLYGHKATVWYNYRNNHAYAVIDNAKAAMVYASDNDSTADGALGKAIKAAGFDPSKNLAADKVHWSAEYGQFDDNSTISTPSAINMYTVIDNTGNGGIDAIIRLNAEVAQIIETNTTASTKTLTLGGKKASGFGTLGVIVASGSGNKILPNSTTKLGEIVTAWQVAGTTGAANDTTDPETAYYRLSSPLKTVTGTVATYTVADSKVGSVKLTTGETISRSGILTAEQDIAYYANKGVDPTDISAGVNYTFVVDDLGRFLDISSPNEWSFLYATYADFQYGAMGSGDIDYKMYGIDWEGKNVNDKTLTWMNLDGNKYGPGLGSDGTLGEGYAKTIPSVVLNVTKKDMATNSVQPGNHIGVMMNSKGQMVTVGTDGITDGSIQMLSGSTWTITRQDAANGFARVPDGGNDYMLTNDTLFYVVTGFGTGATVKTYKGVAELVGSSTSATISYTTGDNEVWFKTGSYAYDKIDTTNNKTVTMVILSAANLKDYSAQNLYYCSDATATGVKLAGLDTIEQYELWLNGEPGTYFLDTTGSGATPADNKFYTLSKSTEYNGVPIYEAKEITASTDPKMDDYVNGGVCAVDKTYNYIMVNQYNKAQIGSYVMNVDGAKVADTADTTGRIEIDSLLKLNNAVSTGYVVTVAIVNDGINVATIYVTDVVAPSP